MEYLKYNASKKRERYSRRPLFLSLAVRNSGLCVCQILRFCRLLSSDFSRPASYRKRKKMPASGFQSRFSRSQENRRLHICGESRKYVTSPASLASYHACSGNEGVKPELLIPSMIIKFVILISLNHCTSFFWCQVRKEIKCTD